MKKERRVKQVSRGSVPWDERYERRNRPHDYSTNKAKQVGHFFPDQRQRE